MELNIRGDKLEVTKAIKDYIADKMGRLEKYFDNSSKIKANVVIKVKNEEQKIEVTVLTSKFTLRAEEKHNDLYSAIDLIIDKLERQIRKNKTKLNKKYKNIISFTDFKDNDNEVDSDNLKIIKRKSITTKPMDEEEALLQMELLNHDFFVFKNIDEECVSVIYKRRDNDYGIINVK